LPSAHEADFRRISQRPEPFGIATESCVERKDPTPDDQLLDAGDDLGRGVVAGVGNLIQQGAVTLVTDARQGRERQFADDARQFAIIDPG
jgi:hypothetical protein